MTFSCAVSFFVYASKIPDLSLPPCRRHLFVTPCLHPSILFKNLPLGIKYLKLLRKIGKRRTKCFFEVSSCWGREYQVEFKVMTLAISLGLTNLINYIL
jgi:hypothetical protein